MLGGARAPENREFSLLPADGAREPVPHREERGAAAVVLDVAVGRLRRDAKLRRDLLGQQRQ